MTLAIAAKDIAANSLENIQLEFDLNPGTAAGVSVVLSGLPVTAEVTGGIKQSDGSWSIPAAKLAAVSVQLIEPVDQPIRITATALGTDAEGKVVSTSTSFLLTAVIPAHASTTRQKVSLAITLSMFTFAIFCLWRWLYIEAQGVLNQESVVQWTAAEGVHVAPGPISFWYDAKGHELTHRGPIGTARKTELLALAYALPDSTASTTNGASQEASQNTISGRDPRLISYSGAIDQLAFKSNEHLEKYFVYLILIAGLSGVLGTLIRSFDNFVHVSTKANKLDVATYWPWYAVRPIVGFLLGLLALLLVEAKIFVPTTDQPPSGTVWWMAVAMLVGFAADDFAQRLRLIGKSFFGKD